jgi:hypothetical protein
VLSENCGRSSAPRRIRSSQHGPKRLLRKMKTLANCPEGAAPTLVVRLSSRRSPPPGAGEGREGGDFREGVSATVVPSESFAEKASLK